MLSYFQALTANKQFPEAEKLALDFLQKEKTYGAMYDMLYLEYARQNRLADGEKLLKLKVENNPKNGNLRHPVGHSLFPVEGSSRPWTR